MNLVLLITKIVCNNVPGVGVEEVPEWTDVVLRGLTIPNIPIAGKNGTFNHN
jgi:hypothetical protein